VLRQRRRRDALVRGEYRRVAPSHNHEVNALGQAVSALASQLERKLAQLTHQATHDPLSRLPNRKLFLQCLDEALVQGDGTGVAVLFLDLDNFKLINDSYGHPVGDRVLRHLADLIQRHSRKANVVVRYGGDEFCIIVPEGDLDTARGVAERVLTEIRNSPFGDEAHSVPPQSLTVSAGVTSYRPEEDNAFSFFKRADENLLTAKRSGKDRVVAE